MDSEDFDNEQSIDHQVATLAVSSTAAKSTVKKDFDTEDDQEELTK